MPARFIAMPVTTPADAVETYRGDASHFAHVQEHLFIPAIAKAGYDPVRPIARGADLIQSEIVRNLEAAELVLCDISLLNPNVFCELGIRTALDRPVCLVRDETTPRIPFDTGIINFHTYQSGLHPWQLDTEIEGLAEHIKETAVRADGRNSLWRYFGLTQRGTDAINSAPADPQESALQVILNEVRSLRGVAGPSNATPLAVTLDDAERFESFMSIASRIADDLNADIVGHVLNGDNLDLYLGEFGLDDDRRTAIVQIGAQYGFTVRFRQGAPTVE